MTRIIAVDGYYGHGNLGDDMMLVALSSMLKQAGFSAIIVRSHSDETLPDLKSDLPMVTYKRRSGKFSDLFAWIRAAWQADTFLVGGGSLFPEDSWIRTLYRLLPIILGKWGGKKTGIVGVSVDPVGSPLHKLVWRLGIKSVDLFIVRDSHSEKILRSFLPGRNIIAGRDLTFAGPTPSPRAMPCAYPEDADVPPGCLPKLAVIAPANLWGYDVSTAHVGRERYEFLISVLVGVCNDLVSRGYRLGLVPFYLSRDQELLADLRKRLAPAAASLCEFVARGRVRQSFRRASIAIAMRYHAMVLSVQESVPFLGICYDWKSISLMGELGLGELAVHYFREPQPTDDLTADKAKKIADQIVSSPEKFRGLVASAGDAAFSQSEQADYVGEITRRFAETDPRLRRGRNMRR